MTLGQKDSTGAKSLALYMVNSGLISSTTNTTQSDL